jgi:predicted O-methyltransferase YrrM
MSTAVKHKETAERVLQEIEESGETNFLPIIGRTKGKYLAETVKKTGARNILEIGSLIGYSAILMAENMPADRKITTIEINTDSAKKALENILRAGFSNSIRIINGDALKVIPELKGKFDLMFIDASKNEYMGYLRLAESKLKPGGVLFADNVKMFADAMSDYLDYVRHSGKYKSQYIDVGFDGVEISTRAN